MSTRSTVLTVLRGDAAHRICFNFTGINGIRVEVDRRSFERVATAIENGSVHLLTASTMPLAGAQAVYYSGAATVTATDGSTINIQANSLFVPPIHGRVQEGYLMHEGVHASLDLTASSAIRAVDDEAAAYITDALYYRMTGRDRARYNREAWEHARTVASSILRSGNADSAAITSLQSSILAHRLYSHHGRTGAYLRDG